MLIQNYHNDSEKVQLLNLLAELKKQRKEMGGYIEHFYSDEKTIMVKLTNGILKIDEQLLQPSTNNDTEAVIKELKKLAEGFVVATIV
ncbi:MAG TPA: hypothetical protein VFM79_00055 [Pelobium sp.]|nr:hypothetical protein [Pelobium sp.]